MTTVAESDLDTTAWHRLSYRVIWVDLLRSFISLLPGAIAIVFFDADTSFSTLWPLYLIAAFGVGRSVANILRWAFTSYRVTPNEVERRTGLFFRRHRSVHRDRLRSVDTHAKFLNRLMGLRVVTIGAGQQLAAGESAFQLNALSKGDAHLLRVELLGGGAQAQAAPLDDEEGLNETTVPAPDDVDVWETLRPGWVVFNLFSVWAFLTGAGLLFGLHALLSLFGVDLWGAASGITDWDSMGPVAVGAIAVAFVAVVGMIGMGVNFFATNWNFELARVRSGDKVFLRTRRGLFSTREVNRDESRVRGLSIGEPLVWRWMGMADTMIITTGLSIWDPGAPITLVPRGPKRVADNVAARLFPVNSPFDAPLTRHPRAALRRRLGWATLVCAAIAATLVAPVATGAVAVELMWIPAALWPLCLIAGVVSYRALGHALPPDYLVVRSGLTNRMTTALRRDAVSTIAIRQSVLQRRLGLSTVSAMSAAGWGIYQAKDTDARSAVHLAHQAAPGLLEPFLESGTETNT